jgi:hypothetical protein
MRALSLLNESCNEMATGSAEARFIKRQEFRRHRARKSRAATAKIAAEETTINPSIDISD